MSSSGRWLFRVVVAVAVLTVIQLVVRTLLPDAETGGLPFTAFIASNLAAAALLVWLATYGAYAGRGLVAALFALHFGITSLASMIEAVVFDIVAPAQAVVALASSAIVALAFALFVTWLVGRFDGSRSEPVSLASGSAPRWIARIAGCSALYLMLYFIAGMIIYPLVREFYETIGLPSMGTTVKLQLFVRGPMFVAAVMLLVTMVRARRSRRALVAGIAMAMLGGVIPLLVATPLFPEAVRWAHFGEVTSSNFLFGLITGFVMAGREALRADATRPASTQAALAAMS